MPWELRADWTAQENLWDCVRVNVKACRTKAAAHGVALDEVSGVQCLVPVSRPPNKNIFLLVAVHGHDGVTSLDFSWEDTLSHMEEPVADDDAVEYVLQALHGVKLCQKGAPGRLPCSLPFDPNEDRSSRRD